MTTATTDTTSAPGTDPAAAPAHASGAPRRPAWRREIVIVAVGLAAGLGIAGVAGGIHLPGGDDRPSAPLATAGSLSAPVAPPVVGAPPGNPASDPRAAVERFLDAEIAGDLEQSYRLLSAADRAEHSSPAGWTVAHADLLPFTGYEILDVATGDDRAEVAAEVTLRSSIDEVVGLVPARASVVWTVVVEDGGWVIDHDAARFTAQYPDEALVADEARSWLEDRHACRAAREYDAGLVGAAGAIVDGLCGASPQHRLSGEVGRLDVSDGAPFVSAFGTSAIDWARTVAVTGSPGLRIVLAPVDDAWLVVGAIPTR